MYVRAYWLDIFSDSADWHPVDEFSESQMKILLYTDAKSLYDHIKKEGTVPDDRLTVVALAALKGEVSAGPG